MMIIMYTLSSVYRLFYIFYQNSICVYYYFISSLGNLATIDLYC